jgi:hypothetical protein
MSAFDITRVAHHGSVQFGDGLSTSAKTWGSGTPLVCIEAIFKSQTQVVCRSLVPLRCRTRFPKSLFYVG